MPPRAGSCPGSCRCRGPRIGHTRDACSPPTRLYAPGSGRDLLPADQVLPAALAVAAEIAAASPVSVSFTKALLWRASTAESPLLALGLDSAALRELGARPDCAEGVQAFLDRR